MRPDGFVYDARAPRIVFGAGVLSYGLVAYWLDLAGIRRRIARGLADPKR